MLLIVLAVIAAIGTIISPNLEQDLSYHLFSDQVHCCTIPNFWNVVSNLPFLVVGLLGLKNTRSDSASKLHKQVFFIGISLVAFGSGYYHWNPNNNTLIWDRLPMTIAFMALFSLIIGKFVSKKAGNKSLIPLLVVGACSVLYWASFDDLKFYALVQFYPLLAIPIILFCFNSKKQSTWGYWALLLAYIAAKLFEHYDHEVHQAISFISGHSIKHIVAAMGVYCLLYYFKNQQENTNKQPYS